MQDVIDRLADTIRAAHPESPLCIRGGASKDFYGNCAPGRDNNLLDTRAYHGIVSYDPTELVVTARAGTRLIDLESELLANRQMLAFDPPHFTESATIGGCIAAGLSGPRRSSAGSVRDFVLGVRMMDGKGDDLHFGGQVMKNVAGYDVSRLMVGSMGTLGLLLEISLKVLPRPSVEMTVTLQMNESDAIERMNHWAGKPLPISATCFYNNTLMLRLSGAEPAVRVAHLKLGGERLEDGDAFWRSVRDQTHPFFQSNQFLWRLSIKSTTPQLSLPGQQLIEWGGSLRWLITDPDLPHEDVRKMSKAAGGHATLFRGCKPSMDAFHPLSPEMMLIHRRLKEKFDPLRILNPGRLFPEL
jgi:glycolate oxidase FAD binding subunit